MKTNSELILEVGIIDFNQPIPESMIQHLINLTRANALESINSNSIPSWEDAIVSACVDQPNWVPNKFILKLRQHLDRYPNFKPERVAEMFIAADPKTRKYYCHQDVSTFTKSIHKSNSFRSLCDSQS